MSAGPLENTIAMIFSALRENCKKATAHSVKSSTYTEVLPPAELAPFVQACWFFEPGFAEPTRDVLIPEGVVDVVFNFGEPYHRRAASNDEVGHWCGEDLIAGQRTELFLVEWPLDTRLFSIRLRPETAYLFFTFPLHEITNKTLPVPGTAFSGLSDVIGGMTFKDKELIARSCFQYLNEKVRNFSTPDSRVLAMIRSIEKSQGASDIQEICKEIVVQPRTIERLFAIKVGISPKRFARIVRLHHFLTARHERLSQKLTDAAVDADYYDQSHLIREFKQFTGESPARFFYAPPEIHEPLLASLISRRDSGNFWRGG